MNMKKFFVPLFLILIFSCSNEGIKPDERAAKTQNDVHCYVEHSGDYYEKISETLCEQIGGREGYKPVDVSSSSDEESSSSSRGNRSSSSRTGGSSSDGEINSSSDGEISSSSRIGGSSSGGVVSSSSGVAGSSSSVGAGSSSSVGAGSSSSIGASSSSSSEAVSSSSSEALPAPAWSECNIPQYVGRNEPIANLKFISIEHNNGRCGTITYRLNSTGQGQPVTTLSYNNNQIGTNQTLNITASTTCSGGITLGQKSCSKSITVADYLKFIEAGADTVLKAGRTIVEVGGVPVSKNEFGCQARDNSGSPNPFEGKTSFILNGVTASVTDNPWWVKTAITSNRMLFESNNANVGSYRCQIE